FGVANLGRAVLTEANLNGAHLGTANLGAADLSGAAVIEADLSGARLTKANLNEANLTRAILIIANLIEVNLVDANLSLANLSRAVLSWANLSGTGLVGTDFTLARLGYTSLGGVDLSAAKGLETVRHEAPSTVGIDTIYKSHGKIPEVFLRGCGVPENFIAYMHSLTGQAFEFYSCFISYSSKDQEFAERLHADLQDKGVRCWFAPEDLKIGDRFQERIEESIRMHDKLLLVLSENSVVSPWVEREVQAAFEREHRSKKLVLFPIRVDEAVMEA